MFKKGDVVRGRFNRERVVCDVIESMYLYVDINDGEFYFNPTKSAVSTNTLEKNYEKVGEVKDIDKFNVVLFEGMKKITEEMLHLNVELGEFKINYNQND